MPIIMDQDMIQTFSSQTAHEPFTNSIRLGRPPAVVTKYQKRISGPLLDRIDIHIEVPRVDYEKLSGNRLGETTEIIRQRVQAARDIQNIRFAKSMVHRYRLQCRHAHRGDQAILSVTG